MPDPLAREPLACTVVIPCRDEAPALPGVFSTIPERMEVIVVDNGSVDDTADVARRLGADVVHEEVAGYGAAVHTGILAATTPLVAVLDGDGSMDAGDLAELVTVVDRGTATMAIGRRRPETRDSWPWHARAGTAVLAWWIRHSSGFAVHDLAPMRVCRRDDLLALDIRDRRFGYPLELMIRASRAGWTVHEKDIVYRRRAQGTKSKVSGTVVGTWRTIVDFAGVLR
ncbi:glycosyltransferase family 2 protein [Brevibacterium sp. K11IcPPYGO002]|uniref:glycosyltransferase family 2 protein n=1 Tax=Brevibacterium sp. K11IcPPYGO002 TaxID=3058837 RepID=UPI003D81AC70